MKYKLEELIVPDVQSYLTYNEIDFHLTPDTQADSGLFDDTPAVSKILNSSDGKWTGIGVFTMEGIPTEYLDILVVHEVIERYERWSEGIPEAEAHKIATAFHLKYARKFKNEKTFAEFLAENKFAHYTR